MKLENYDLLQQVTEIGIQIKIRLDNKKLIFCCSRCGIGVEFLELFFKHIEAHISTDLNEMYLAKSGWVVTK